MRLPRRLRSRLVASHLVVALAILGTVLMAVSLVGPGYFAAAMGHPLDDPTGRQMDATTLAAFQDAMRTALVAGLLIGLVTAIVVAVALSSRLARPISRLVAASSRIAAGHYAQRVPGADGEVGALATSFNAMATSLEATERRRLELVGDVAHELRTPIATLDGYLEGLEDGVVRSEPQTWTLLRRETGRLSRLVTDLSELWRAEARQLPLSIETLDAVEIIADVVAQFGGPAAGRTIALESDAGAVPVRADRDRLAQVVSNYLSNAVRYSPNGSTIVVSVRRCGHEAVVSVRDAGPGLTPDQRAHVFERFYRVDASRSRALGGAGIGLAIVRALALAMDGRAWADSDGPGTGSTFRVALPGA